MATVRHMLPTEHACSHSNAAVLCFQVFFAVLIGAFSISQAAPNLDKLVTAAGASVAIYDVIDRVSATLAVCRYVESS